MVTKTLTITEDVYKLLIGNKLEKESFSEELRRLLSKRKTKTLADFFGIISKEEGADILRGMERRRTINRTLLRQRQKEWT